METLTLKQTIYNFACGPTKIDGAINIDIDASLKPDKVLDLMEFPYDLSEQADKIYFFHGIEHLESKWHAVVLNEFRRILKDDGLLVISYPEFKTCAQNWIDNKNGWRDFWEATIYGRQSTKHDFHVSLMHTPAFKQLLELVGFEVIDEKSEVKQEFNTIITAKKGPYGLTREEGIKEELFS